MRSVRARHDPLAAHRAQAARLAGRQDDQVARPRRPQVLTGHYLSSPLHGSHHQAEWRGVKRDLRPSSKAAITALNRSISAITI